MRHALFVIGLALYFYLAIWEQDMTRYRIWRRRQAFIKAMASNGDKEGPLRVMLWSNPRTLSTVFLKCMSFVEGTQSINEPYAVARVAGPERPIPSDPEVLASYEAFEKTYETKLTTVDLDLPKAFDDKECTFQWVKDMLDAPYKDKKLIFCKDQAFGIHGRFHMLPEGYLHTFLIRSPYKIYPSWKNVMLNMMPPEVKHLIQLDQLPEVMMPLKLGLGELYDLLDYVTENLKAKPIVIDADDLQRNPSSILRQYCQAIGIPFQESMLTWEKGNDITQDWIASSNFIRGNKLDTGGYYDEALNSTCFHPMKPLRAKNDLTDDVVRCIDKVMPVYEKMYEMRLRP